MGNRSSETLFSEIEIATGIDIARSNLKNPLSSLLSKMRKILSKQVCAYVYSEFYAAYPN